MTGRASAATPYDEERVRRATQQTETETETELLSTADTCGGLGQHWPHGINDRVHLSTSAPRTPVSVTRPP